MCIHHSFHLLPCVPLSVFAACRCLTDNQWEPETEFTLCEHLMELLEMPEKVGSWDLHNAKSFQITQGDNRWHASTICMYFESVFSFISLTFLTFSRFFHVCCTAIVFVCVRMFLVWHSDYFSMRSLCFWCLFFLVHSECCSMLQQCCTCFWSCGAVFQVRGLVAELNFVKAAKAALVDAPALHSQAVMWDTQETNSFTLFILATLDTFGH